MASFDPFMPSQPSNSNSDNSIPFGWVELRDPATGLPYYANQVTGETQWSFPTTTPPTTPALQKEAIILTNFDCMKLYRH